jgi:hypothetical protein
MFISIMVVLSTWFLFQWLFVWARKQRRKNFTRTKGGKIREVVDGIPLVVTATSRYLNFPPNQPTHTQARLVLTEQWLVLASDKGVLFRTNRGGGLKLKSLGEGRWMLLGTSPNKQTDLRIVFLVGDATWINSLQQFCG